MFPVSYDLIWFNPNWIGVYSITYKDYVLRKRLGGCSLQIKLQNKKIKKVTFRVIGIVWKLQWPTTGETSWPIVFLCFKPVEHVCRSKHTMFFFPCYFTFFQPNLLCSTLIAVESTYKKKKRIGKMCNHSFFMEHFQEHKTGGLSVCP